MSRPHHSHAVYFGPALARDPQQLEGQLQLLLQQGHHRPAADGPFQLGNHQSCGNTELVSTAAFIHTVTVTCRPVEHRRGDCLQHPILSRTARVTC